MQHALLISLAVALGAAAPVWGQAPEEPAPDSQQLLIAVQRICPVSGQPLGGHGPPVAARIGEQIVYLCCKPCLSNRVDADHWSTIQANLAKAQQKCPVMDKPLPDKAQPVVVDGRVIYICCPPCTDKIVGDRERYFRSVDQLYAAHLQAEQAQRARAQRKGPLH